MRDPCRFEQFVLILGRFLGLGIGLRAIQRPDQDGFHVVSSARSSQREGMDGIAMPFHNLKVALAPLPQRRRCAVWLASPASIHGPYSATRVPSVATHRALVACLRVVRDCPHHVAEERLRMLACHAVVKARRLIRPP